MNTTTTGTNPNDDSSSDDAGSSEIIFPHNYSKKRRKRMAESTSEAKESLIQREESFFDTNGPKPLQTYALHITESTICDLYPVTAQRRMVAGQQVVIGRGDLSGCGINLRCQKVSRVHAEITLHVDGTIKIRDLDSINGVLVNRVRIFPGIGIEIYPGDVISIGDATIQVKLFEEPDATIV